MLHGDSFKAKRFKKRPIDVSPSILLLFLLLVQEIKRDIIYRRFNLPPSAHQIIDPRRLTAYLGSAIRRLHAYLQYIGFVKYAKASETLKRLQDLLVA
jgi:hypothetical protein